MLPSLRTLARWVLIFCDPRKLISWKYIPRYINHWCRFRSMDSAPLRLIDSYPCVADWVYATPYDPHYFYQGGWLARRIAAACPGLHVDVGSSVQMLSVLSAQVLTVFVDYRPLNARLDNLICVGGNIVSLPFADASLQSLSCMHVIEHIGLGRYGDPLDPAGTAKAEGELQRVLAPGGKLYLTAPVGRERVCFNAHRVFAPESILAMLPNMKLVSFSLVGDDGCFLPDCAINAAEGLDYGCGLFVMEKRGIFDHSSA